MVAGDESAKGRTKTANVVLIPFTTGDLRAGVTQGVMDFEGWYLRQPCGVGRPGYRERHLRSNSAHGKTGCTDRSHTGPPGAHIQKLTLRGAFRGGGASGPDPLTLAAAHWAWSARRRDGCHGAACQ